jgi:hypothetical protein
LVDLIAGVGVVAKNFASVFFCLQGVGSSIQMMESLLLRALESMLWQ